MEYNHLKYVEKYINYKYSTYCNKFSIKEMDSLIMKVANDVRKKYNNIKFVLNGGADKFICSVVDEYMLDKHPKYVADYTNLKNYVTKYIYANYFVNYSEETLDVVVEYICSMMMASYNYNKLMDGMKDEEIKFSYEMVFDDFCELIRQYVFDYISSNIIPLTDIDNGVVAEDVVKLFVSNNEISILDLLLSRYDRLIEAMAAKNRSKNEEKRRSDMPNTYEYIDSQILYKTQNSELLKNIINKIDTTLRDRGILPKEIVSGEYDAEIRNLYHDYYSESVNSSLRENSIQIDGVPRKIKRNSKKQNIPQAISSVLIVATLLSLLAVGGHELGENIRIDTAKKNLSEIDSYSYSQMNGIYDRGIEPTAANILKTYDEYSKFNNTNFNYLAFYRAYISANQNQMNVMDTVINEVKKDARNNSGYTDLYYALRSNSCYLDFMYDRLYEMGFTEIKDEKYFDLLAKYVQHKNNHPYDDPAEFLTDKEKRLLSKVKDKYEELSEYYLIELGLYLDDPEYFEKYSNSGGRNHI